MLNEFIDVTLKDLRPAEAKVWMVLFRDSRNGTSKVSQSHIAERCGITRESVSRAIKELEQRDLVRTVHHGGVSETQLQSMLKSMPTFPLVNGECKSTGPPAPIEILRVLEEQQGLKPRTITQLYQTHEKSFRITVEPIYDKVVAVRDNPLIGRASLHLLRYRCTVQYTAADGIECPFKGDSNWYSGGGLTTEITLNVDWDHLHREDDKQLNSVSAIENADAAKLFGLQDMEKDGVRSQATSATEQAFDRNDARSVVEAFVAAAIAGRIDEAASLVDQTEILAEDRPASRHAMAEFFRQLNVQQLAMNSVYVNDPTKPTTALAISEAVKLTRRQPDGRRDSLMVLRLTMSAGGWLLTDDELESEESAERELKQFLEANPNSIDLPPGPDKEEFAAALDKLLSNRKENVGKQEGTSGLPSAEVDETLKSLVESLNPIQGDWVVESPGPWFYPTDKLGDSAVSNFVMRIRTNHVELRPFPHVGEQPVTKLLLHPIHDGRPGHFGVDSDPSAVDQQFDPGEFSFEVREDQLQVQFIHAKSSESNQSDQGSEPPKHFSARRATGEEQRKFAQDRFQHVRIYGYKNPDRTNPEAVVESYVAASLAGDVATATSLGERYAARPDQSIAWNKLWNLNDFAIKAVRVRGQVVTPMRVTAAEAIVVSELMHRTSPANIGDVSIGHHVALLKNVDGKWVVSAFDLWTTDHYNQGIENFLNAAKNSLNEKPQASASP